MATVDLRRGDARMRTRLDWLDSRHSFSFGAHYDPANTHFGLLLASNDDVVAPGGGFATHPHRDVEIVTWVLDGALAHHDSAGHEGVVVPGLAQRMSAGSGIRHAETNHHADRPVRFVQMWVVPDEPSIRPSYAQRDVSAALGSRRLVPVASGRGHDAAVPLRQRDATLWAGRPAAGGELALPAAPYVHLYVARGDVTLEGAGPLAEGDAARITAADGRRVTAGAAGAEVLVWEMHAALGG